MTVFLLEHRTSLVICWPLRIDTSKRKPCPDNLLPGTVSPRSGSEPRRADPITALYLLLRNMICQKGRGFPFSRSGELHLFGSATHSSVDFNRNRLDFRELKILDSVILKAGSKRCWRCGKERVARALCHGCAADVLV